MVGFILRATGGYTLNCSAVIHFGERQVHTLLSSLVSAHARMYEGSQHFRDLGTIHRVSSMAMATLPTDGSFGKGKRGAHTPIPIERKPSQSPELKRTLLNLGMRFPIGTSLWYSVLQAAAGSSAVSPAGTEFHFLQWPFPSTGRIFQCSLQTHVSETKTGIIIDT